MNEKSLLETYCSNLENTENRFVLTKFDPEDKIDLFTKNHLIVFLTKGSVRIQIEPNKPFHVDAPSMFLVPKGKYYERVALTTSEMLVLPFRSHLDISYISAIKSTEDNQTLLGNVQLSDSLYVLEIKPMLINYVDLLKEAFSVGFTDADFFSLKIKELMFLIERIYSPEEQLNFFYPILNNDYVFSDFIYNNYKKLKFRKLKTGVAIKA
ncbi:hypothetical protein [Massilibacteroides sp.]|uniref:hypothetical protein n=1 Tax=Massilibacteroides sp. TaxID=2034766 RepID=UPI0026179AA2|nr:hypothetical protein [Massilibacteroides sp.]MDD4516748.1 hypothetical protein [Massilibacteroides sp.]